MIFGFVLKDGSFLPESDALERIDDWNDTWARGAQYAGRLEEIDREEVSNIFHREGITQDPINLFLRNLESGPLPQILGTIYFTKSLKPSWNKFLHHILITYDFKALIATPEGRKTILAFLQEEKSIFAETISRTLHKAPLKILRLLNRPRPRGRPADILGQTYLRSFCAGLIETYRLTFQETPATHRDSPLVSLAHYFLGKAHHALSDSRIAKILHDQIPAK